MADPRFPIPREYQSQLRWVPAADARSDDEILQSLRQYAPITSEKNLWTYWHAGIDQMPNWAQRNVTNWARLCGPSWTIRVLDTIPDSTNHALKFIQPDMLPETFVKGTMEGPYVGPHSADFLRNAALWLYGGCWLDVGAILVRSIDDLCWRLLEDDTSPYRVGMSLMWAQHVQNHIVAARKGDPFIKRGHDLFMHVWKGKTSHDGVIEHPLLFFWKFVDFEESRRRGFKWEWAVDEMTIVNYVAQLMAWERVVLVEEPDGSWNGPEYFTKHFLLWDALKEDWPAEASVGFKGEELFNVLACSRNADPNSEAYKKAYEFAWGLLAQSSMQKIVHGKGLTKTEACGTILDRPENQDLDLKEGTFFELLRYGQVHFEQTRRGIPYVKAEAPLPEHIIRKGLFEE